MHQLHKKLELPTNMGGPVADIPKSPTEPNTPVDPKLQVDPKSPVDSNTPVDPKLPVDPKPPVDPNTPVDPKPPVDPNTPVDPKPPVVDPKPPVLDPKPPEPTQPTQPTITVSPKTGDILVEWYAGNGKYYSSVFFNDFYTSQKELDENALNNLTNYYSKKKTGRLLAN